MRKPLKYQIMLPLSVVMLVTVVSVSLVNAWLAGSRTRQQIENQLQDISETLARSNFPLTNAVLEQMEGLSGAEFAVSDSEQIVTAASGKVKLGTKLAEQSTVEPPTSIVLDQRLNIGNETYFHVSLDLNRSAQSQQAAVLHVLYPEVRYRQAVREAVLPPLLLGTIALVLVTSLSMFVAWRVTRPIHRLRDQVDRVARGQFAPLPVPSSDDELRDLSVAVNRMAEMLAQHEENVRRTERLRTLDQLAGGIAHQLRNNVTGCRMAVDLHQRDCPLHSDESIEVAVQQLELMESYLRRFLALGRQSDRPFCPLDMAELVNDVLPLVRPGAKHLGVMIDWHRPSQPFLFNGDGDGLSQAMVNLLINAIDAASRYRSDCVGNSEHRKVTIRIGRSNDTISVDVLDTGSGPSEEVRERLFEPLVSGKPDGVGLGLSLAKEIVERHAGRISWARVNNVTRFSIELPTAVPERTNVDVACC